MAVSNERGTKSTNSGRNICRWWDFVHWRMPIPSAIQGQKYICLFTFRKNGIAVPTAVWFGEDGDRLYVMTRNDSGKYKRIQNNRKVRVAPCTIRGKITGPEYAGTAEILSRDNWQKARTSVHKKYWLARLPFWSKKNVYLEIEVTV